jgi:hypothetical protein
MTVPVFPEDRLDVRPWPDPVLDHLGHDPRSAYVERYWLPILGPSSTWLVRRLAGRLDEHPDGFPLDPATWAVELGLGMRGGRHGPFWRSLDRACRFGAARRNGPMLVVRRRLAPLTSQQVERLPPDLREQHHEWTAAQLRQPRRATVTRAGARPMPPPPVDAGRAAPTRSAQ